MPRTDFSIAHQRALTVNNYTFHHFFELDTNPPVFLWTGAGSIEYNGKTYAGLGTLLEVIDTELTFEILLNQTDFVFSGLDDNLLREALDEDIRGTSGRLFLGFLNENRRVIGEFINLQEITVSSVGTSLSENGSITLTLYSITGIGNLVYPTDITWTKESQQRFIKDQGLNILDTGFSFVEDVPSSSPTWVSGPERPDNEIGGFGGAIPIANPRVREALGLVGINSMAPTVDNPAIELDYINTRIIRDPVDV